MMSQKKKKQDGEKSKYYYQCTKKIEEVRSGEVVRMLTGGKWKPTTVLEKTEPRSYVLRADNEKKYRQNENPILKTEIGERYVIEISDDEIIIKLQTKTWLYRTTRLRK